MGKKRKQETPKPAPGGGSSAPFNNPFGALGGVGAPELASPTSPTSPTNPVRAAVAAPSDPPAEDPYGGKLVVRHSRRGHGGKTVTLLQGLRGPAALHADIATRIGRALGCGARSPLDAPGEVHVAGDQRARLCAWLRAEGAREVVLGS